MRITDALSSGKIPNSDAEILLAALLGKERTWILAHPEHVLAPHDWERWLQWEKRRLADEPVAYITERQQFFGRTFIVNRHTLVPRPATEKLVEIALELLRTQSAPVRLSMDIDQDIIAGVHIWNPLDDVACVADIGTGSGCIGVTIACERPDLHIVATDINEQTLVTAKKNATMYGVGDRIEFVLGKNMEPLANRKEPFLIVSNPPYIPTTVEVERGVRDYEPHTALFSGKDGADVLRAIIAEAKANPDCCGYVIECRKDQEKWLV